MGSLTPSTTLSTTPLLSCPVVRAKSGKERARERLANIGKILLILEQFFPWSHFTSFYSSILEKLHADSMDAIFDLAILARRSRRVSLGDVTAHGRVQD